MTDKKSEVIPAQPKSVAVVQLSPIQAMERAKAAGLDVKEMQEMLALQKEYEANEARKAFHRALAEFKKDPPTVIKDMLNTQYGSDYVSIWNMVNTVTKELGKYDLHTRWDFPESEGNTISCTCIMAHALGHEESVTITGPVDESGKKNPLQGRKSTRTYLKLETFEAVTGMASVSGNIDDDANTPIEYITEEQALELHARATENEVYDSFMKWLNTQKIKSIDNIQACNYEHISKKLDVSIKARKDDAKD